MNTEKFRMWVFTAMAAVPMADVLFTLVRKHSLSQTVLWVPTLIAFVVFMVYPFVKKDLRLYKITCGCVAIACTVITILIRQINL